jgi:flagellar hook protein FlgE
VPPALDPNLVTGGPFAIDFDSNGALDVPGAPFAIPIDMTMATPNPVVFANGAADLLINWNLLDSLLQPTLSSVASNSAVTDIFQDGTPSAELLSISIADGGKINGLYSDGRTLLLAQLALQRFNNPQTLLATGNNNFVPTAASGVSAPGEANSGGLGSIIGVSLEFSNVDIAQEFTNLLTYQRGFQANSRVITTADELNQEALNLKR